METEKKSPKLTAILEIEQHLKRLGESVDHRWRGRTWRIGSGGLFRTLDHSLPPTTANEVAVPFGDLDLPELEEVRLALRRTPTPEFVKNTTAVKSALAKLREAFAGRAEA